MGHGLLIFGPHQLTPSHTLVFCCNSHRHCNFRPCSSPQCHPPPHPTFAVGEEGCCHHLEPQLTAVQTQLTTTTATPLLSHAFTAPITPVPAPCFSLSCPKPHHNYMQTPHYHHHNCPPLSSFPIPHLHTNPLCPTFTTSKPHSPTPCLSCLPPLSSALHQPLLLCSSLLQSFTFLDYACSIDMLTFATNIENMLSSLYLAAGTIA